MQESFAGNGWLRCRLSRICTAGTALLLTALLGAAAARAQDNSVGGEANLKLPDLSSVPFFGIDGHKLLTSASCSASSG